MKVEAHVITAVKLSAEELRRWQTIQAARADLRTPFLTPEFTAAVSQARTGVRVCVLRAGDEIAGFLPFQFASPAHRLLGAAEPVGEPMNDYFGLIACDHLRLSGAALVRAAGLAYLGFTHLDEAQLDHGLEAEKPETGLQICLKRGGAEYWKELADRDKKFTEDTLRRERRLERDCGPLRFKFEAEPEALAQLLDQKRKQYRRSGVADIFAPDWRRALVERLARSKAPECTGVLSTLYAGDTWVASHFGLRGYGTLHYWFPVYNHDLPKYAPGRLLLKQIIQAATENGIERIDRGIGDSQAKRDFANFRHQYYRGAWHRPGVRSFIYRVNCSLRWRLLESAPQLARPLKEAGEGI